MFSGPMIGSKVMGRCLVSVSSAGLGADKRLVRPLGSVLMTVTSVEGTR